MTSFSRNQQNRPGPSPEPQDRLRLPEPSVRTLYEGPDWAIHVRQSPTGISELGISRVLGEKIETKFLALLGTDRDKVVESFFRTRLYRSEDRINRFQQDLETRDLMWVIEPTPLARQFKSTDFQVVRTFKGVLPNRANFEVTASAFMNEAGLVNPRTVKLTAMEYTSQDGIRRPTWLSTDFTTQGQMLFNKVCPSTAREFTAEDFLEIKRRMGDSSPLPETEEVSTSKALAKIAQAILAA